MKTTFYWEKHIGFFILPTVEVETYNSSHYGNEWPMVFGITFMWLKFILCFEFRKKEQPEIEHRPPESE